MASRSRPPRSAKSPVALLYRANQNASNVFEARAFQYELTARQFEVLLAISRNEGLSQSQLVAKTDLDRSTFADFSFDAIDVSGDATTGIAPRNVVVSNASFSNNGTSGQGGTGDISLFQYNGDASLSNLTLVGKPVPMLLGESFDSGNAALVPPVRIEEFYMTSVSPAV